MQKPDSRLSSQSGIAIGAILFVIAILAVLGTAISASGNFMGSTVTPDRVSADIKAQANLIRSKIMECYIYGRNRYSESLPNASDPMPSDMYPSSTGAGTNVIDLDCPGFATGQKNLWAGQSAASLPPSPTGFDPWVYKNAGATGGRCIRIQPSTGLATDAGIKNGLSLVSGYFSNGERVYDSNSSSQRFILWITRPSGTADADCSS